MDEIHEKTVCFTGHRTIPASDLAQLKRVLKEALRKEIACGARVFRAGGALGFDTVAALAVLDLKQEYPSIRLHLILPCPTQAEEWSPADKECYEKILAAADDARYVSPFYFNGLLQMRNRALVEGADACIAYLRESNGGGAGYTSALAIKSGLDYVNLADLIKKS